MTRRRRAFGPGVAIPLLAMAACGAPVPDAVGMNDGRLAPCPNTPNCVHTGLQHPEGTRPMLLRPEWRSSEVVTGVSSVLSRMPRVTISRGTDVYLHAEFRSRMLRFVDDLEVLVADGELIVRSASRLGRSDLGVNARRVERLRSALVDAGIVR